jgi:hypothetical protein
MDPTIIEELTGITGSELTELENAEAELERAGDMSQPADQVAPSKAQKSC